MGIKINPNIIVPAEPSKDYLECNIHISDELNVIVTRGVIVEFDPSIIEQHNVTGFVNCIIRKPENPFWNISDVDTSTIVLNETARPSSTSFCFDNNGTEFILAKFSKDLLLFIFENQNLVEYEMVILRINGQLKNGDFFAGSTQLRIVH